MPEPDRKPGDTSNHHPVSHVPQSIKHKISDLSTGSVENDERQESSHFALSEQDQASRSQDLKEHAITKGLWEKAHAKIDPKLLHIHEECVLQGDQENSEDRAESLQRVVKQKLDAVEHSRLRIKVGNEEVVVRDQIQEALGTVLRFSEVISAAIKAEAHAALAWGGVAAILPVGKWANAFMPEG
ncbi:hypothetical protein SI65_08793 [Aspergillus cristatus]|uniref:NWD NACHT-NTPase N-terminal domain-containing protein n=1 Tax=Aspergillus cristatus TaxID=573508 RepID=A0A1E3B4R6_ASPCR|nr:hypothetical protein SI65_08793 [Aspergillus cristatus]